MSKSLSGLEIKKHRNVLLLPKVINLPALWKLIGLFGHVARQISSSISFLPQAWPPRPPPLSASETTQSFQLRHLSLSLHRSSHFLQHFSSGFACKSCLNLQKWLIINVELFKMFKAFKSCFVFVFWLNNNG